MSQVDTQCSLDYIVVSLNFPATLFPVISCLFTFCRYLMELQPPLLQPQLQLEFKDTVVGYFLLLRVSLLQLLMLLGPLSVVSIQSLTLKFTHFGFLFFMISKQMVVTLKPCIIIRGAQL